MQYDYPMPSNYRTGFSVCQMSIGAFYANQTTTSVIQVALANLVSNSTGFGVQVLTTAQDFWSVTYRWAVSLGEPLILLAGFRGSDSPPGEVGVEGALPATFSVSSFLKVGFLISGILESMNNTNASLSCQIGSAQSTNFNSFYQDNLVPVQADGTIDYSNSSALPFTGPSSVNMQVVTSNNNSIYACQLQFTVVVHTVGFRNQQTLLTGYNSFNRSGFVSGRFFYTFSPSTHNSYYNSAPATIFGYSSLILIGRAVDVALVDLTTLTVATDGSSRSAIAGTFFFYLNNSLCSHSANVTNTWAPQGNARFNTVAGTLELGVNSKIETTIATTPGQLISMTFSIGQP